MCISNKDKRCEKASSLLPAEASKEMNPFLPLPHDGATDPGGCSSTQSPAAHKAPTWHQRPAGTAKKPGHNHKGLHGMKVSNSHVNPPCHCERSTLLLQHLEEEFLKFPGRRLERFEPKEDVKIMQMFLLGLPGVPGFASQILCTPH